MKYIVHEKQKIIDASSIEMQKDHKSDFLKYNLTN